LITLLSGLLLACPLLCGADEAGLHAHATTLGQDGQPTDHSDHDCPEGSDNCVCKGAVSSAGNDVRGAVRSITLAPALFYLPAIAPLAIGLCQHHLSWKGTPTGLAGWGDSLTILALLQTFRC